MKKIKEGIGYIRFMKRVHDVETNKTCAAHNEFIKFDVMVRDDGTEFRHNFRVDNETKILTYNENHYNIHNYSGKKELSSKDKIEITTMSIVMFIVIILILFTNNILQTILLK